MIIKYKFNLLICNIQSIKILKIINIYLFISYIFKQKLINFFKMFLKMFYKFFIIFYKVNINFKIFYNIIKNNVNITIFILYKKYYIWIM